MAKKHDENKDLRSVGRVARIDYSSHCVLVPNKEAVGIHTWGKIDFLCHYCGWHLVYDKSAFVSKAQPVKRDNESEDKKPWKKKREPKHDLTDKTKKKNKK